MSRELVARFQVTRVYQVSAFGKSEEECYDNLDEVKPEEYELIDEEVELIETDYANF